MLFGALGEMITGAVNRAITAVERLPAKAKLVAASIVEKATGRTCEKCEHYAKGSCWHPDFDTRDKCITSLRPVGFEKRTYRSTIRTKKR